MLWRCLRRGARLKEPRSFRRLIDRASHRKARSRAGMGEMSLSLATAVANSVTPTGSSPVPGCQDVER
jgi:hypothetical protein